MLSISTTLKNSIKQVAIGRFDGMHLGHQEIFKQLDKNCGAILVIDIGYANLTPHKYKKNYVDIPIVFVKLSDIKQFSAEEFVCDFLQKEFINLEKIVVGYDFAFGKNRLGNTKNLKELFHKDVVVVQEVLKDSISVHSRHIRALIENSKVEQANKLLGYNYSIVGIHIKGQGVGQKQLFATINIVVDEFLIPSDGVYATYTIIDDIRYKSISFIGHRLSTDNNFAVETHLINKDFFCDDDKEIKIEFLKKIRDNKKFQDLEELKKQIQQDIDICENLS
jgi:riboflavin kinase/FMN adenylyltransferase